ncbi:hypothetical protein DFAR_3800003 [Desulfarculales bacterium]
MVDMSPAFLAAIAVEEVRRA